MPLEANAVKADKLRGFSVKPGAPIRLRRVLRTKIQMELKRTKMPFTDINEWCVPLSRALTAADVKLLHDILDLVENSDDQDLSDAFEYYKVIEY